MANLTSEAKGFLTIKIKDKKVDGAHGLKKNILFEVIAFHVV